MTTSEQTRSCLVCGAQMLAGTQRCDSCGATDKDQPKCPFCGVVAQPRPHRHLRLACPACGAPRVPAAGALEPSKKTDGALAAARSAKSSRDVWRLAASFASAFGLLGLLVLVGVAVIASPSFVPLVAAGIVASMPLVFAALALRNAKRREHQLKASLDVAWLEAAKRLTATQGSIRPGQLANAFDIDERAAIGLAAQLGAQREVTTEVTDDGELSLSVGTPMRTRVPESPVRVDEREQQPEPEEQVKVEATTQSHATTKVAQ